VGFDLLNAKTLFGVSQEAGGGLPGISNGLSNAAPLQPHRLIRSSASRLR
jgi:hypothetical protein